MNDAVETAEYDGIVYEKRSIADGEFGEPSTSSRIRQDIHITCGDKLFFIDPRHSKRVDIHMTVVTVKGINGNVIELEESLVSYIACCHHRIIKLPKETNIKDFISIFE